ncbi:DUF1684 domain-containing protein [bacterium]|nr:DUF1684 domain-containing protein [bacterium]
MKKGVFYLSVLLLSAMLTNFSGCSKNNKHTDILKWEQNLIKARQDKDKEFKTSPTSPFAGLARLTAQQGETKYLVYKKGKYSLSDKKINGTLFSVSQKQNKWLFKSFNSGLKCFSSGKPIKSGDILGEMTEGRYKKYHFVIYPLDERLVIIVFDPDKESIKNFQHLLYYTPDPDYRINAKFKRFKKLNKIEMLTSQNQIKTFYRYAKIIFKIKGQKEFLIAYKKDLTKGPGEAWIFIPFNDKTNGKATYPAGRFFEIKEPFGDKFILDFNEAFNPLCNYSHVYNCSYPPDENSLDIPIKAGEKRYPIEH